MRPGRGMLPPPPKAERAMAKMTEAGLNRGRRIILMQRKVGNLGNLGRTTG